MAFDDILGQTQPIHILRQALTHGNLSHAYLFYGPESIGKKRTAFELARALNCPESGPREACGHCTSCRKIPQGLHPDVFFLEPQKKSDAVREAWIRIEQVRDLQKKLGFLPYEGRTKVVIVDAVDRMNPQAANAFLKTLEEPPSATVCLLLTDQPQQLLPTLVSRCQGIRFHPLSQETLVRLLHQLAPERDLPAGEIPFRAARAGGQVRRALEADLSEWRALREQLLTLVGEVSLDRPDLLFESSAQWARRAGEIPRMLQELAGILRDLVLIQLQVPGHLLWNQDLESQLTPLASRKSRNGWAGLIESVERTRQALRGNANAQLALETLWLDFCEAR